MATPPKPFEASPPSALVRVPPECISRSEAARRLGLPLTSFRRNVEGKQLTPVVLDGQYFFREADVEALVAGGPVAAPPKTSPAPSARPVPVDVDGKTYAQVYAHLDRGFGPADCVRDLALEPKVVDFITAEWCRQREGQWIGHQTVLLLRALYQLAADQEAPPLDQALKKLMKIVAKLQKDLSDEQSVIHFLNEELDRVVVLSIHEQHLLPPSVTTVKPGYSLLTKAYDAVELNDD